MGKSFEPLKQMFSFERSVVRLEDEKLFQPLRQARRRWVLHGPGSYRMSGNCLDTLYELKNGMFVLLAFTSDYPMLDGDVLPCNPGIQGELVDESVAINFLIDNQFEIPEDLEHLLDNVINTDGGSNESKVGPRPLSHWAFDKDFSRVQAFAHEVRVSELLQKLSESAMSCVQEIRSWDVNEADFRSSEEFLLTVTFAARLLDAYQVDPARWWGAKTIVPPDSVDILRLPWPDGIDEIKATTIPQLRKMVVNAACVIFINAVDREYEPPPTWEERRLAKTHLINSLNAIEVNVVKLRDAAEELISGKTYERLLTEGPKHTRPPEMHEFGAFLLKSMGHDRKSILETLKRPEDPGTVSRWITKVRNYIASGNLIPRSIAEQFEKEQPKVKSKSVDPGILDMGRNKEGRTPRQVRKGKDE